MKRFVIVLLVVLALAVAGCSAETTSSDGDDGGAAVGGGEWVKVMTLKGDAAKTSAPFKLKGGEQKLEYTLKGSEMLIATFYVEDKGTDLMEDGGFPVVSPDKAGSDSTRLNKDGGEYIVIVDSANCSWSCTLYEKR
jgi:predicted small secreted protein